MLGAVYPLTDFPSAPWCPHRAHKGASILGSLAKLVPALITVGHPSMKAGAEMTPVP
jgi:hypothetical protein